MELSVTNGGIIGGPSVGSKFFANAADATSVVHRWDFGGSSVTTGGLRLVSNPGIDYFRDAWSERHIRTTLAVVGIPDTPKVFIFWNYSDNISGFERGLEPELNY